MSVNEELYQPSIKQAISSKLDDKKKLIIDRTTPISCTVTVYKHKHATDIEPYEF